jgi:hypothetical protein
MRITDFHKIPYQIGGMVVFSGNAESPRGTKYHFWTLGDELRVTRWGIEKGVKVGRGIKAPPALRAAVWAKVRKAKRK